MGWSNRNFCLRLEGNKQSVESLKEEETNALKIGCKLFPTHSALQFLLTAFLLDSSNFLAINIVVENAQEVQDMTIWQKIK